MSIDDEDADYRAEVREESFAILEEYGDQAVCHIEAQLRRTDLTPRRRSVLEDSHQLLRGPRATRLPGWSPR